ncbi:P-loop containing nucleoside triphosphate hydrolase protein [Fusarium oxysporum II5]|uniref:Adenosinetriphosphatase n=2 Tax=Fusarium oxysporum species complex TaxID=171631 RepID=X0KBM8_FUSO5|nr:uncharacterized protein FOIG_00797 [Fusarium odoratissimum NRRL 54006]EXM10898.1 hypothetical protein FOIG_00797 [Fusarium odoratissimum NRRL 54006]KAK2137152.1 P-loop containing nucleoside triphosphate hydrolase protein [Fusarium oxysporum II5]TXC03441.1 hypothetical protein FocTR4_00001356 [Fusarium oxysporum f. sp. cubense]
MPPDESRLDRLVKQYLDPILDDAQTNAGQLHYHDPGPAIDESLYSGRFMLDIRKEEGYANEDEDEEKKEQEEQEEQEYHEEYYLEQEDVILPLGNPIRREADTHRAPESRLEVTLDGKLIHIVQYLKMEGWMALKSIVTRNDISADVIGVPWLRTELQSWQRIAVMKLLDACNSPLRGLILADETGLGKSLSALVAALFKRQEMLPQCGPVLIVTRMSCLTQWYEETITHFSDEHRPRTIILDNPNISVRRLLEYDVVICSNSFLKRRYLDLEKQELFSSVVHGYDIYTAQSIFPKHKRQRIYQPLHSQLYAALDKRFPVLIFDEAHDGRNEDSQLYSAIRSLDYHHAFLLTATPTYNTWSDFGSLISFLPGSPFQSATHFKDVFATPPLEPNDVGRMGPRGPFLELLVNFAQGSILGRPKSVLGLEKLIEHRIEMEPLSSRSVDLTILAMTMRGRSKIWGIKAVPGKHPYRKAQVHSGLMYLSRAQHLANHEFLIGANGNYEEGKQVRAESLSNVLGQFQRILEHMAIAKHRDTLASSFLPPFFAEQDVSKELLFNFLDWATRSLSENDSVDAIVAKWTPTLSRLQLLQFINQEPHFRDAISKYIRDRSGQAAKDETLTPISRSIDTLSNEEYAEFKDSMRSLDPVIYIPRNLLLSQMDDDTEMDVVDGGSISQQPEGAAIDASRVTPRPTTPELQAVQQSIYNDGNFNYAQDQEDLDYDPNSEHLTRETIVEDENVRDDTRKPILPNALALKTWKEYLQAITTEELLSPKARLVIDLIQNLRQSHPREKIVIASASVKFLDMLQEYLARKFPAIQTASYNGNTKSAKERMRIIKEFNLNGAGPDILLLSASCGGTGLNLHGGSHLIITEHFWTPGLRDQVIGRVYRMQQTRRVHVYEIDSGTEIDLLLKEFVGNKTTTGVTPLEQAFRRSDLADAVTPRLPTDYELRRELQRYDDRDHLVTFANRVGKKRKKIYRFTSDGEENPEYSADSEETDDPYDSGDPQEKWEQFVAQFPPDKDDADDEGDENDSVEAEDTWATFRFGLIQAEERAKKRDNWFMSEGQ